MSRNFQIGTKVRVKETGEIGIIKGREFINNTQHHVKVEYIVKLGEGFDHWKSFSRRELENIPQPSEASTSIYPKIFTSQFSRNERTLLMVGIVEKIKTNSQNKKTKRLKIGWAIQHPEDNFDVNVGTKLAIKRAKECPISRITSEFNGEFNEDMVVNTLRNKAEFIFNNIEKFINK